MNSGKDDTVESAVSSLRTTEGPDLWKIVGFLTDENSIDLNDSMSSAAVEDGLGNMLKESIVASEKAHLIKAELADLRAELGLLTGLAEPDREKDRSAAPAKQIQSGRRSRRTVPPSSTSSSHSSDSDVNVVDVGTDMSFFDQTHGPRGVRRRGAGLVLAKQFAKRVLLRTFGNPRRGAPASGVRSSRGRTAAPTATKKIPQEKNGERQAGSVSENESHDEENTITGDVTLIRRSVPSDDEDGWMEVNDEASSEASSVNGEDSSDRDSVFRSSFESFKKKGNRSGDDSESYLETSDRSEDLEATLMGTPEAPQLGQFLLPLLTAQEQAETAQQHEGRGITLIHNKILEILSSTEEQMNLQRGDVQQPQERPAPETGLERVADYTEDCDGRHIGQQEITDVLEQIHQEEAVHDLATPEAVLSLDHTFVSMDIYPESPPPQFNREYDLEWWKTMACALSALGGAGAVVVTESDTKWCGLLKLPCLCCHCRNKKTYMDTIRQHLSLLISVMKLNNDIAHEVELLEDMLQPAVCTCTLFYTNVEGITQSCHRCLQSTLFAKIEELRSSVEAWRHLSHLVQVINSSDQLLLAADSRCCCQRRGQEDRGPYRQLSHDDQIRRAVAFFVSGVMDTSYFKVDIVPASEDVPKSRALRFLDHLQKNSRLKIAPLRGEDANYCTKEWSPPCPHCTCSCATVRTYSRSDCTKALSDALQRMNSLAVTAGLPDLVNEELIPELAVMLTESRAATVATCGRRDTAHKLLTDIVIGCEWSCGIHLLKSPQIIYDANVCTAYAVFTTLLARRFLEITCKDYPKTRHGLTLMVTGENFDLFSSFMLARAFMGELMTYKDSYLTLDDVDIKEFDERLVVLVNILSINTTGTEILSLVYQPQEEICRAKAISKSIPCIEKFITHVKSGNSDNEVGTSDEAELELLHTMDYLIKAAKSLVSLMFVVLNHAGLQQLDSLDPVLNGSLSRAYTTMLEYYSPGPVTPLQCCNAGHRVQDWKCLNGKLLEFDRQVSELYARLPSIHRTQTRALQKLLDVLKSTYPVGIGIMLTPLRYCHTAVPLLNRAMINHQTLTPRQSQRVLAWLVYTRVLGHAQLFNEVHRKVIELQEQYEVLVRLRLHPLTPPTSISDLNIVNIEAGANVPPMLSRPQQRTRQKSPHEQQHRAGKRKLKPTKSEEWQGEGGTAGASTGAKQPDVFYFNYKGNKHHQQDGRSREVNTNNNNASSNKNEISMSMKECIAKFAKCTVNGKTEEPQTDYKYDCRSPPLAEVAPQDQDSKLLFGRVKRPFRLGQSSLFQQYKRTGLSVVDSDKTDSISNDDNKTFNKIANECDPNDVLLLESVAPLEDKVIDEMMATHANKSADVRPPAKDEHCKLKCCQNETGNIFEKIFNTLMLMNKSADGKSVLNGEVLVAKCMQEAMKISDSPDDVKGVPRILLSIMPEVAAKLAELVSISTELPEFASIICSLPDCIDDAQSLSPETIKQLKELRMSRSDSSKVTKSKWKNKKCKQSQTDESTDSSVDGNKSLMEILREEIEKEVQTFFKVKDRSKDEQNVFSLWAKWMVIDKILDHVKQFIGDGTADKSAGLEAWRDILPKLKDLQSLSIETISTLKKLAFSFPKSRDEADKPEEAKSKETIQSTAKSKKGGNSLKPKDNGLSIEHLILCSSGDKTQTVSNEKVSKIILEMNNVQCKTGTNPDGCDETKQAYFIEKLQAINKNYVEKLHKKNFTSEDWIMTMNELQELERKLKSAFNRNPAANQSPKAAETREAELLAGKGLSKLIGKSSSKNAAKECPQKAAVKTGDKGTQNTDGCPAHDTSATTEHKEVDYRTEVEELAKKGQLLSRCEEMLKNRGDKSLLDSFYSIKKYMSQGEPVPDKYMEQVVSICSTIDPKSLVDNALNTPAKHAQPDVAECDSCHQTAVHNGCKYSGESDACAAHDDDDDFGCCGPKGNHIAIIGSQNPEAIAKYTAMALRKAKQSLNASAFPQTDAATAAPNGAAAAPNGVADPADCVHSANCCSTKRCRRTQIQPAKTSKEAVAAPADSKATQAKAPQANAGAAVAAANGQHRSGKKCDTGGNSGHHYICRVGHVEGNSSGCGGSNGSHSCNCCYCAVYGHAPPLTSPVSKTFNETRERLRSILFKKKQQGKNGAAGDAMDQSKDHKSDEHQPAQKDQSVGTSPPPGGDPSVAKPSPLEHPSHPDAAVAPPEKCKEQPIAKDATTNTPQQSRSQPPEQPKPAFGSVEGKPPAPNQGKMQQQPARQAAQQKQPAHQKPTVAQKPSQQPKQSAQPQGAQQPLNMKTSTHQPNAPAERSGSTGGKQGACTPPMFTESMLKQTKHLLEQHSKALEQLDRRAKQVKSVRGTADGQSASVVANPPTPLVNGPKATSQLTPTPASSRDVSVSSVSSGCFSYTTLCQAGGGASGRSAPACGQPMPGLVDLRPVGDDPRDLDALLQYIEGPNRGNDKSKKRAKKARQKARKVEARLAQEFEVARQNALEATDAVLSACNEAYNLHAQVDETRKLLKKMMRPEVATSNHSKKKGKKGSQGNSQALLRHRQYVQSVVEQLNELTEMMNQADERKEKAECALREVSETLNRVELELVAVIESTGGSTLDDNDDLSDYEEGGGAGDGGGGTGANKACCEPHTPAESPPASPSLLDTSIVQQLQKNAGDGTVTFRRIGERTFAVMSNGSQLVISRCSDAVNKFATAEPTRPTQLPMKKQGSMPTSWEGAMAQINALAAANSSAPPKKLKKKKPEQAAVPAPAAQPAKPPPAPCQQAALATQKKATFEQRPEKQNKQVASESKSKILEVDVTKLNKKERKALARKAEEAARLEEELKAAQKLKGKEKAGKSKKAVAKENNAQTIEQPPQKKSNKKSTEAANAPQPTQPAKGQARNQAKSKEPAVTNAKAGQQQKAAAAKQAPTGKKQLQPQAAKQTPKPTSHQSPYKGAGRGAADCSVSSLAKRFDNSLKLNADTTIELSNSKKSHPSSAPPSSVMRNSPTACSIMEQLSSGVQVADLRLPPGITLTRVDPSKQILNSIKSVPMPTKPPPAMPTLPKPLLNQTVIHASPPPAACFPPLPVINTSALANSTSAPSKKKNKKKNNKKGQPEVAAAGQSSGGQGQIVTLRNPLYHPDKPTVSVAMQGQAAEAAGPAQPVVGTGNSVLRIPDPIPMPPTACRATITPAPNGMYTIRSPMLSAASLHREIQPPAHAAPPETNESPVATHLLPTLAPSRDRCYSLFDGSADQVAVANGNHNPEPLHGAQPVQQEPIGTPARRTAAVPEPSGGGGLYSLFSSPQRQPHPPQQPVDDSLPYFQRLRAGARLNNEVTIHHVTESKYYRPSYGSIPELPVAPPTSVEISVVQPGGHEAYAGPQAFRAAPVVSAKPTPGSTANGPAPWNYATPSTSSSSLSSSLETPASRVVQPSAANSLYGSVCNSSANSPAQHNLNEPNVCMPSTIGDGWAAWTAQPEPPTLPSDPWLRASCPPTPPGDPCPPPTAQFGPIGSHRHNHIAANPNSIFSDCAPPYQQVSEADLEAFKRYDYYVEPAADRIRSSLSAMQLDK